MTTPSSPQVSSGSSDRVLVIGGMHRSGTSLLASELLGAGLTIGTRLMGGAAGNLAGHFEDLDFVDFHRKALLGNGLPAEGFTADAEPRVPSTLHEEAAQLVATRRKLATNWGWKDPRTTLFLDFWKARIPDAGFVFVFRSPWEVMDSLYRRGDPAFVYNPLIAPRVWLHYNRLIHRFIGRHSDECVILEACQLIADPDGLCVTLRERFGLSLTSAPGRYRADLFNTSSAAVHMALVKMVCPEAVDLYVQLRDLAESTAPLPADASPSLAEQAVIDWAHVSRLARENEALRQDYVATRDAAAAEIAALRSAQAVNADPIRAARAA